MRSRLSLAVALLLAALMPAAAHHGWGSYDARNPVTVEGRILTAKYENPHVTLTVAGQNKTWTLTLAPTSRMLNRGAVREMVEPGKTISAYGYPSTVNADEMRAERITVNGKTVEMR